MRSRILLVFIASLLSPLTAQAEPEGCQPEVCDGVDNDCDGMIDESDTTEQGSSLCGLGAVCVLYEGVYQCASGCQPCGFPCSSGYACESVSHPVNGPQGVKCVLSGCESDCAGVTVPGVGGRLECAPPHPAHPLTPVCVCRGPKIGCRAPCFGVDCPADQTCTNIGPDRGTCVSAFCTEHPCASGLECHQGLCKKSLCEGIECGMDSECQQGQCIPKPLVQAPDSGAPDSGDPTDSNATKDSSKDSDLARVETPGVQSSSGGCGCGVAPRSAGGWLGVGLAFLGLGLARRRSSAQTCMLIRNPTRLARSLTDIQERKILRRTGDLSF